MLLIKIQLIPMAARVAQLVEHWSNKPTVAGSIPVMSMLNVFYLI